LSDNQTPNPQAETQKPVQQEAPAQSR